MADGDDIAHTQFAIQGFLHFIFLITEIDQCQFSVWQIANENSLIHK